MAYTASGNGYINAEVAKHIDEVQIFELNKNLQNAITTGNTQEAVRVAQSIEKKGEVMGARAAKKTMLAKQVLAEINQGGKVSKRLSWQWMMQPVPLMNNLHIWCCWQARCRFGIGI